MITLPRDGNGQAIQIAPTGSTLATTYDATISTSTEVTLNTATSMIEVTAIDKAICMRWGTADASTSAFDHVIPANATARFIVPAGTTAVNFIEQAATAILCLTEF